MPTTSSPRSSSAWDRCEPMKPAQPVTTNVATPRGAGTPGYASWGLTTNRSGTSVMSAAPSLGRTTVPRDTRGSGARKDLPDDRNRLAEGTESGAGRRGGRPGPRRSSGARVAATNPDPVPTSSGAETSRTGSAGSGPSSAGPLRGRARSSSPAALGTAAGADDALAAGQAVGAGGAHRVAAGAPGHRIPHALVGVQNVVARAAGQRIAPRPAAERVGS